MSFFLRCCFLIVIILLATPSFGGAQLMNQDVLNQSKIKKSSFKQILNNIKKTLPRDLRKCSIIVTRVKLLKAEDEFNVDEEWTVDICQEPKVYFVSTSTWPKGYWVDSVELKEERITREKKLLDTAKKLGTEKEWKGNLFYIHEIEAMSQDGNSSNTEEKSQ